MRCRYTLRVCTQSKGLRKSQAAGARGNAPSRYLTAGKDFFLTTNWKLWNIRDAYRSSCSHSRVVASHARLNCFSKLEHVYLIIESYETCAKVYLGLK